MKVRKKPSLQSLYKNIGYTFKRQSFVELALTHSSYKHEMNMLYPENQPHTDNERLEYLGDTILSFVISKALFVSFPHFTEGQLSKFRSILVSKESLFKMAKTLKLVRFLNLGKGETQGSIDTKSSILANTVEALIAAIFLDGGIKKAEQFILAYFSQYFEERKLHRLDKNYKSNLQEYVQKEFRSLPLYETIDKKGMFHSTVSIISGKKGTGWGKSKRIAEQSAARTLLKKLLSAPNKKKRRSRKKSPLPQERLKK